MFNLIGKAAAQAAIPTLAPTTGNTFAAFVTHILAIALYLGGVLAVLYLIWGGVIYVTAGGDQEKATQARTAIVNAIIGIVIIALALVLVNWVGAAAVATTGTGLGNT